MSELIRWALRVGRALIQIIHLPQSVNVGSRAGVCARVIMWQLFE